MVILCFDRRYPKQNSFICLKSNILAPKKIFGVSKPLPCSIPVKKSKSCQIMLILQTPNVYYNLQIFMHANVDSAAVWAPSSSTLLRSWCAVTSNEKSNYDGTIFYVCVYLSELYAKRNIEKNGLGPNQIISVTQNANKLQNVCSWSLIRDKRGLFGL